MEGRAGGGGRERGIECSIPGGEEWRVGRGGGGRERGIECSIPGGEEWRVGRGGGERGI